MNPEQERDFIERQVNKDISRRKFIEWAGKAGIGSAAAMSLSGAVLAACGSGGGAKKIGGASGDTLKVGVIAPFSGLGAFIGFKPLRPRTRYTAKAVWRPSPRAPFETTTWSFRTG